MKVKKGIIGIAVLVVFMAILASFNPVAKAIYPDQLVSLQSVTVGTVQITNGSFENPPLPSNYEYIRGGSTTITGWQTILNGAERGNPSVRVGPGSGNQINIGAAQDGSLIVDLAPLSFSGGGIQQTFNTIVGQSYNLSFYGGTLRRFGRDGTATIDVSVGASNQTFNISNSASTIAWTPFSMCFTATTPTTTVVFKNLQNGGNNFALIDNVSLRTLFFSS